MIKILNAFFSTPQRCLKSEFWSVSFCIFLFNILSVLHCSFLLRLQGRDQSVQLRSVEIHNGQIWEVFSPLLYCQFGRERKASTAPKSNKHPCPANTIVSTATFAIVTLNATPFGPTFLSLPSSLDMVGWAAPRATLPPPPLSFPSVGTYSTLISNVTYQAFSQLPARFSPSPLLLAIVDAWCGEL